MSQPKIVDTLAEECQHQLWLRKLEISGYRHFKRVLSNQEACENDRRDLCTSELAGQILSCLLRNISRLKDKNCYDAVKYVGPFIFSDSYMIEDFLGACLDDIHKYHCGRATGSSTPSISQKYVLKCLALRIEKLSDTCRSRVVDFERLTDKMPAIDPEFYWACKSVLLKRCASDDHLDPYNCLLRYVNEPDISNECKVAVNQRQKLINSAPQMHSRFLNACDKDAKDHQCYEASFKSNIGIHEVLFCLHNAVEAYRNKLTHHPLSAECHHEIYSLQREMLTDLGFNSQLVKSCEKPLFELCKMNVSMLDKSLLNCLAENSLEAGQRNEYFTDACLSQLDHMANLTNVIRHPKLDPILATECSDILLQKCFPNSQRVRQATSPMALACIYELRNDPMMNDACYQSLHLIIIFSLKNATMSQSFRTACRDDLEGVCRGNSEIGRGGAADLLCVLRHRDIPDGSPKKLTTQCSTEVANYFNAFAKSVYLSPLVLERCTHELVEYCSIEMDFYRKPGNDLALKDPIDCLMKNFASLDASCGEVVTSVAETFGGSPARHHVLAEKCDAVVEKRCPEAKASPQKLAACLLEKKLAVEDEACMAAMVAWTSADRLSRAPSNNLFRECVEDVNKFCAIHIRTGGISVMRCLVARFVDNMLTIVQAQENSRPLTARCEKALHLELMVEQTFIRMNSKLIGSCKSELSELCSNTSASELQCLRKNSNNLGRKCHEAVFREQMLEAIDNSLDTELLTACSSWIKRECAAEYNALHRHVQRNDRANTQTSHDSVVSCLISYQLKAHELMVEQPIDGDCQRVLYQRMAERSEDYRLDPQLKQNCDVDIRKHCSLQMSSPDVESRRHKVLDCLRKRYIRPGDVALEPQCIPHVHRLVVLSNMNYHLDPQLKTSCEQEIRQYCQLAVVQVESGDDMGLVTDCLKDELKAGRITNQACMGEVLRSLNEGLVDVEADTILFQACAKDISTICSKVPRGNGQVMNCLLYYLDKNQLSKTCSAKMNVRRELWSYASQTAPIESMTDVLLVFRESGLLHQIIYMTLAVLGIMCSFMFTLGRMTRRTAILKNQ